MPTAEHRAEAAQYRMEGTMNSIVSAISRENYEGAAKMYADTIRIRRKNRLEDRWPNEQRFINILRRDNPGKKDYLEGKLRRAPRAS